MTTTTRSRLRAADLLPVGTVGLRARKLRAGLSALGIAIGIAAIVAVLGITRSSQAALLAQIDQLGTNLLTVVNGRSLQGEEVAVLRGPPAAVALIAVGSECCCCQVGHVSACSFREGR